MLRTFLPAKDKDLNEWAITFVANATPNVTALHLTAAQVTSVSNAQKAFSLLIDSEANLKDQLKANTLKKRAARKTLAGLASQANNQVQGYSDVTADLKSLCGLTVRKKPAKQTPLTPTNLSANAQANGVNNLAWTTGGNRPGVEYVIEAYKDSLTGWQTVDVVNPRKFAHTGQAPGVPMIYRVSARRRGITSAPSDTVSVYSPRLTMTVTDGSISKAA